MHKCNQHWAIWRRENHPNNHWSATNQLAKEKRPRLTCRECSPIEHEAERLKHTAN